MSLKTHRLLFITLTIFFALQPSFYGVFDGHRGEACARMLAENLAGEIAASASFEADVSILGTTGVEKAEPDSYPPQNDHNHHSLIIDSPSTHIYIENSFPRPI